MKKRLMSLKIPHMSHIYSHMASLQPIFVEIFEVKIGGCIWLTTISIYLVLFYFKL